MKATLDQVYSIREESLVYTRTQKGDIMIYMEKSGASSETFLIEGVARTIFESIDGHRPLRAIIELVRSGLDLEENAIPEIEQLTLSFVTDLLNFEIVEST